MTVPGIGPITATALTATVGDATVFESGRHLAAWLGMNKSQQMRWSRRGVDLLLQVRCVGFNGKLGSSFGQLFQAVDPASELAMTA